MEWIPGSSAATGCSCSSKQKGLTAEEDLRRPQLVQRQGSQMGWRVLDSQLKLSRRGFAPGSACIFFFYQNQACDKCEPGKLVVQFVGNNWRRRF